MAEQNESIMELDVATDEEKQLAEEASKFYKQKNFEAARLKLEQLKSKRPTDIRVAQNLLLSKQSSTFLEDLEKLIAVHQSELEDVDSCVALLNSALLHFKSQRFDRAQQILDKLTLFTEPLGEVLSRDVFILYMETCLRLNYPEKVPTLINSLETLLYGKNNANRSTGSPADKESTADKHSDLKSLLHQYRVRCLLAIRSLKACKREVKSLNGEDRERSDEASAAFSVFIRAHLEHHRDNGRKAVKILNTLQGKPFLSKNYLAAMYYNDMACVHFKAGKTSLALLYARHAIEEYNRQTNSGEPHRRKFLFDLMYNTATCKLFSESYEVAFEEFLRCVRIVPKNPYVWMRLAECSILVHHKKNGAKLDPTSIVKQYVGKGAQRKILLQEDPSRRIITKKSKEVTVAPTIDFAARSLRVCIACLNETETRVSKVEASGDGTPCATANLEIRLLRNSALCALAYVSLCLGDYREAQCVAETLSKQENLSPAQQVLGRLYLAESLLMQDQLSEAIEYLKPSDADMSTKPVIGEETEAHYSVQPDMYWLPASQEDTKQVFLYNLAVAYALREELNKADEIVRTLLKQHGDNPPANLLRLTIYLHLQQGRPHLAKLLICQDLPLS